MVTKQILEILQVLPENKYFKRDKDSAHLISKEHLVKITKRGIFINDTNLIPKIKTQGQTDFDISQCKYLLLELSKYLVRVNHFGISYLCADFDKEIYYYKKIINNTKLKIYKEESYSNNNDWYWLGNTEEWQMPLFEIVLNKTNIEGWIPHFQIDIDVNLDIAQIEELTNKFFLDFIKWKLDFKDKDVLVGMGILGSIKGTKICLGIGTNKRHVDIHRKMVLKEIHS